MGIENVLQQSNIIIFIKELGFPIASFVIMVSILMYVMKKNERRQETTDVRFDKLIDKIMLTAEEHSNKHQQSLEDITEDLKNMTIDLKIVIAKIDTFKTIIEEKLEASSLSYIFEGNKDKFQKDKTRK